MAPTVLRYGFKVFLDHEAAASAVNGGFVVSTDNLLLPLGVRSQSSAGSLRFEHAVFQVVSGDGEVTMDITQKRQGEEIKFGQVVRLLHVTSNSFLCESRRLRASREKANQRVVLADFTSEELRGSRWRVVPRYKVRSEGQKICNRDVVVLQSLAGDTTLHVCNGSDSSSDNYYEINAGLTASGFKLRIYDMQTTGVGEGRELRCGDCIQLFHREERAFFVANHTKKPMSELTGRESPGSRTPPAAGGLTPMGSVTTPQLARSQQRGGQASGAATLGMSSMDDAKEPREQSTYDEVALEELPDAVSTNEYLNSNSMFVVESDNTFAGGSVQFGSKKRFRLKSLATGAYLCAFQRRGGLLASVQAGGKTPPSDRIAAMSTETFMASSAVVMPQPVPGGPAGAPTGQGLASAFSSSLAAASAGVAADEKGAAGGGGGDDDDDTRRRADDVDHGITVVLVKDKLEATMLYFEQAADDASTTARSHSRVFVIFPLQDGRWLSCSGLPPGGIEPSGGLRQSISLGDFGAAEASRRKYAVCSTRASHRDGIELIKVPRSDFQNLNFVLSQLPPLQRLIKNLKRQAGELRPIDRLRVLPTSQLVAQVRENLSTLGRLCTVSGEDNVLVREGQPDTMAQNRLVDQSVPELCLELVEAIFISPHFINHDSFKKMIAIEEDLLPPNKDGADHAAALAGQPVSTSVTLKYSDLHLLVRLCFRLVRMTCLGNPRTATALEPFIERLMVFVEYGYGAFDALAEIFNGNETLVLSEAEGDRELAQRFIAMAIASGRAKAANPMHILGLLASCAGAGVRAQQNMIGEALLARDLTLHQGEAELRESVKEQPADAPTPEPDGVDVPSHKDAAAFLDPKKTPMDSDLGGSDHQTPRQESLADATMPLFYRLWIEDRIVRIDHSNRFATASSSKIGSSAYDTSEDDNGGSPGALGIALEDFASRDSWNEGNRFGSRSSFASSTGHTQNAGPRLLSGNSPAYALLRQVHLLTALSRSRHAENITMAREILPVDVALAVIKNDELPGDLRAAFVDFVVVTSIDVAPFRDETEAASSLVRVWDALPTAGADPASEQRALFNCETAVGAPPPIAGQLKDHFKEILAQQSALNPYDKPVNLLITTIVSALHTMTRFGLVPQDEFMLWMEILTPVLDGRDDAKPPVTEAYRRRFGEFNRHRYDEDNHQLMKCKMELIRTMRTFALFARAVMVSKLILAFRRGTEIEHTSTLLDIRCDSYVDKESAKFAEERESRRKKADGNMFQQGFGAIADVAGAGLGAMQSVGGALMSVIPGQKNDHPLQFMVDVFDVLMDITQYEYKPLVIQAVGLFIDLANSHRGVLQQLRRVQILQSTKSVEFYEYVSPTVAAIGKYSDRTIIFSESAHLIDNIHQLSKTLALPAGYSPSSESSVTRDPEQHAILKNLGAHTAVANACRSIASHATGGDPATGKVKGWVQEVLVAAYEFLELMVADSKPVAWDLFPFVEIFTRHLPIRAGSLDVVRHMLDGNLDLCSSLNDGVMTDIVLAMSVTDYDPRVGHLLHLLVFQDGQLIRRNQAQVLKALLDGDEMILRCRDITTGHVGRRNREMKMREEEYKDPTSRIIFHLQVVQIVAHCVTGRNDAMVRSEVRSAMFGSTTLDDVIEVTCNRALPYFFRTPYIMLFSALYLEDTNIRLPLLEHKHFLKLLKTIGEAALELSTLADAAAAQQPRSKSQQGASTIEPVSPAKGSSLLLCDEVHIHWFFHGIVPALKKIVTIHLKDLGDDEETAAIDATAISGEVGSLGHSMNEALADIVRIYPYERPPDEMIPGQVPLDPEDAAVTPQEKGVFGGLFGGDEAAATAPKPKMDWVSPLPQRLRGGTDFFNEVENSHNSSGRCRNIRESLTVPYIPIHCVKDLGGVIELLVEQELFDGDDDNADGAGHHGEDPLKEEMMEARQTAAALIQPITRDEVEEIAESLQLFTAWQDFCDKYAGQVEGTSDELAFRSAAVLILRKSRAGHRAVMSMVRVIDHSDLDMNTRVALLHLFRQLLLCDDDDLSDATLIIKEAEDFELEPREVAKGLQKWEIEKELLTLDKDQEARQNIFASWQGSMLLPPRVVNMLSSQNRELLIAALRCLNEMLRDGNQKVQAAVLNWAKDRSDEDFFAQIRVRMVQCREQLRDRRRAIRRDLGDDSNRTERLPASLHRRLARRFNFDIPLLFLELVQLLCEGHYLDMQNYFRIQPDNQISINILESITGVIEVLAKSVDSATHNLAMQTIATITELLQGPCPDNQTFMVSQNIGDVVSRFFTTNFYDITDNETWSLRHSSVVLLQSLMEGHMNVSMITTLMTSLDLSPLVETMDTTYREWADERGIRATSNPVDIVVDAVKDFVRGLVSGLGEGNEFEDDLNLACSIFIFMKTILDVETLVYIEEFARGTIDEHSDQMADKTGKGIKELFRTSKTYKFLSRKIATIEIRRNGKLEKVYFRIPSICLYNLKKESRDNVIQTIQRDGDGVRVGDFFERSFGLMREMEYYEEMRQTRGLSLLQKYDPLFDNLSLLLAFTINIFLLFTVHSDNQDTSDNHMKDGDIATTYYALGLCQIIIQCFLFVTFFFGPTRIYLEERWTQFEGLMNRKAVEDSKKSLGIEQPNIDPNPSAKLPFFVRWILSFLFLLIWPSFYKRATFLIIAFIGFYFSPIWYCIQMLQIVSKSPTLQNVVESVTKNWKSLILTGCLLLVVVYIFSIIAYFSYSEYYGEGDFGIGGDCRSLLRCTVIHLVYGLKMGGGISELTPPPIYGASQDLVAYGRLLFDFLFFLILIIMFLNLVFGTILDTFGQLREERDFVETDQEGKCFICGQQRGEFDRIPSSGFDHHVEFDHRMWDYLYFMHYVKLKPSDDHNGQEHYVAQCMSTHEPLFYPIGEAMAVHAHKMGEKEALDGDDANHHGHHDDDGRTETAAKGGDEKEMLAVHEMGIEGGVSGAFNARGGGDGGLTADETVARLQKLEDMLAQVLILQTMGGGDARSAA